jgi:hypothetical protein
MRRIKLTNEQMDRALGIVNFVLGGRACAGKCGRNIVGDEPASISIGDKHWHMKCWRERTEKEGT